MYHQPTYKKEFLILAYDDIPENQLGQYWVNKLIERIKKEKLKKYLHERSFARTKDFNISRD